MAGLVIALTLVAAAPVAAQGPAVSYRLPFEAGVQATVDQGWHGAYSHTGLAAFAYDFTVPEGTLVLAAASGTVAFAHGGETGCGGAERLLHANFVTLDHADGSATHYGHLSAIAVEPGQAVVEGQVIGWVGATGFTNCHAHLHFARQAQGAPVTQSLPVYFAELPEQVLVMGQAVLAGLLAVELQSALAIELRIESVALRADVRRRLGVLRGAGYPLPLFADEEDGVRPAGSLDADP